MNKSQDQRLPTLHTALGVAMLLAVIAAYLLTPRLTTVGNPPLLEEVIPKQFGDWKEIPSPYVQASLAVAREDEPDINQPYDQTLMRTYQNSKGEVVMLALAWGKNQRQEVKIHRPELCYTAQGYKVQSLAPVTLANIKGVAGPVTGKRMVAMNRFGGEAVSYWIRIGDIYSESAVDTRWHILKEGLAGRIPDGILVRASVQIRDAINLEANHTLAEQFLTALVQHLPPSEKSILIR